MVVTQQYIFSNNGKSVKQLGMADVDMVDIISEAQSFMSMCYNVEIDGNMSETRYKVWLARMEKVNICSAPKLRSLPPTSDAFAQHLPCTLPDHDLEISTGQWTT